MEHLFSFRILCHVIQKRPLDPPSWRSPATMFSYEWDSCKSLGQVKEEALLLPGFRNV